MVLVHLPFKQASKYANILNTIRCLFIYLFSKPASSFNNILKYSCKQRCGFLLRLRNQGKIYILYNFGKKSKRRKEEWKKERIEERRVKKEVSCERTL